MERQVLYVDGGCSGNGVRDMSARRMVSVVTNDRGVVWSEKTERGGSNNIAELIAVRDALILCRENGIRRVLIRTDSRNNLAWVNGSKVGKGINDRQRVLSLKEDIASLRQAVDMAIEWVPRELNLAGRYIESSQGL